MSLRPKQQKALDALLEHGNITAAAEAAGVNRKTLHEWLREDDFQAAVRDATGATVRTLGMRLNAEVDASVTKMVALRDDPKTPPSVQLRAADMIVTHARELHELQVIEDRLSAIETALAIRNGR